MLVAGKHVLCEKPLCVNTEQVKEVFRVAKENNRFFMEAVWSRAFPIYKNIRDEIRSGNIGDVLLVTAAFCFPSCEHPIWKDYNGFGTLPLIGIYTVQFANWIFENTKPSSVTAVGTLGQKDEDGCIILSYDNGAKASLSYSGKCQILNGAVVYGTKGCIHLPDYFWCPTEVLLPSGKMTCPLEPEDPSAYVYPNSMGLRYEADEVRKCIMEGESMFTDSFYSL
ncbi:hypothetical protein FSP39_021638 [Pinctada imbricata]|uniref:Trans-1,2-dihydrobenzene-1,2-diol dehydrogenase n=1 Tax=Pinctada imbricata TaxID=66713 RepID=A0AA88YK49_PINIB|nr:hypothetical protein FSP39_021638 [Pinctada imbricata]